jgi:hypothetical protein
MDVLALSRRIPLLGFFGGSAGDDDFADRLNYKYTVAILVVFAFIITNKHFGHNQVIAQLENFFFFILNFEFFIFLFKDKLLGSRLVHLFFFYQK